MVIDLFLDRAIAVAYPKVGYSINQYDLSGVFNKRKKNAMSVSEALVSFSSLSINY